MDNETMKAILERLLTERLKASTIKLMLHVLTFPGQCVEWSKFNQSAVAEKLGMKYTATCLGIKELCDKGFMEKRGNTHLTEYRVLVENFRKEAHAA